MPNLLPSDPETPRAVLKEYFPLAKFISKWRKYWNTRQSIKRGEDLFDLSDDQLKEFGLVPPLKFNWYEVFFAAIPAQIIITVFNFFTPAQSAASSSPFWQDVAQLAHIIASVVDGLLIPVIAPLILLGLAWVASFTCLEKIAHTKSERRRCARAYLFYNGTYGLFPQMLFGLVVGLWRGNAKLTDFIVASGWRFLVWLTALLAVASYLFYITYNKIPNLIFEIYGYSRKGQFWKRQRRLWRYFRHVGGATVIISAVLKYVIAPLIVYSIIGFSYAIVWLKTIAGRGAAAG